MKKAKPIEIIHNYLKTLDENGNISTTETENALNAFVQYLFDLKNLDINSIRYAIHKSDIDSENDDFVASMNQEGKNLYNIYLNKHNFHIHDISKISTVFDMFRNLAHEVHHIFQYILSPKLMKKYDKFRDSLYEDVDILQTTKYNANNKLHLIKKL